MPTNTSFDPKHINEFNKTKLNKDAHGVAAICTAGQTTNIDYTLTDDSCITGGTCLVQNATQGDYINLQVVHPVFGVVAQYVTNWFVDPSRTLQETPKSLYPAKLTTGTILRVAYVSTGQTAPWCAINYDIEKVLM